MPTGPTLGGFDDGFDDGKVAKKTDAKAEAVHIRVQQRNGKKSLTTVQGLPKEFDLKKILKALKKEYCCNGCVVEDEENGETQHNESGTHIVIRKDKATQNSEFDTFKLALMPPISSRVLA